MASIVNVHAGPRLRRRCGSYPDVGLQLAVPHSRGEAERGGAGNYVEA